MNKTLPIAFLAALSLTLAACGNKGPLVRPSQAPAPQAEPAPAPAELPSDLPPAQDAAPPADDGNG
jgi:predicted small lipoprotein YifL